VAWVWGTRQTDQVKEANTEQIISSRLFVNGKGGNYGCQGNQQPVDMPIKFGLGNIEAAYDELRISDVPRYWDDFTPPARDKEFQMDEHTRALFHFNGNCNGESYGITNTLTAMLK
jgi:hypothetical protein